MKKKTKVQEKKKIKIKKGVPIPSSRNTPTYPFLEMEVGDSFSVPYKTRHTGSHLLTAANRQCKVRKLKWKFTTRQMIGIVAIWRIE